MGTREKLFRQKLANQIEALLTSSEKVFTSEKLDHQWVDKMLLDTQDLTKALTIYQFLHELPEDENLQLAFLELDEQEENKKPETNIPNYGEEILKEINEVENQDAEEVFEVNVVIETTEPENDKEEDIIMEESDLEEVVVEADSEPEQIDSTPNEVAQAEEVPETIVEAAPKESEIVKEAKSSSEDIVVTEINDTISKSEPSLADKLSTKSIKKLAESIALNERFLYANELFDGNMEAFKRALTELDHIASLEDAQRFIDLQLKKDNNWDLNNETVKSFITLVERRF